MEKFGVTCVTVVQAGEQPELTYAGTGPNQVRQSKQANRANVQQEEDPKSIRPANKPAARTYRLNTPVRGDSITRHR